jgi:hypothetical protein
MLRLALALLLGFAVTGCAADKRFTLKPPSHIPKWADQSPPGL